MADGRCSSQNPPKRRVRIKPCHDAEKHIRLKTDKAGLREVLVNSYKGRGVFASIPFIKGDFVLEYRGKLFPPDSPPVLETYSETEATYLFDFQWKGKSWCLDASLEDQSLGRLVNDEHKNPNCKVQTIQVENMPHLCLFAIRDIMPGEEVTYNYGDSDWPWRKQIYMSPPTTPSVDDNLNGSHQSVVPVEPLSPSVNKVCDFATTKTNRVQLILHLCMRMLSFKTQTHTCFLKNAISPMYKASSNPYVHLHLGR
ncbi:histone-lysine N-methyltransferase set-1-like [Centropristis striata]|uniref:histone-lysine N-methyltransferase set-1-like n=1 Tax=Centropristis striata TaxID=184440 RepID=UPI0027DEC8E7|nr:histone-lysine N-methyltransferase set-1-like [Centropristis striata]